jgi:arylsulfatase A-like enzyme
MRLLPNDPELYRTAYRDQFDQMPVPKTYIPKDSIKDKKIPEHVYSGEYIKSYNFVHTRESLKERVVRTCQTVTGIDNLVGTVVEELKKDNILDNTIIVFLSDHGLQFGEHGLGGKVLLYEESIRIPMIIFDPRVPENKRGRKVEELCGSVDIAPTLIDLAGYEVPASMQGKSMKPLMYGKKTKWRKEFFCESNMMTQDYPRMECVRTNEWKYIRYYSKDKDQHHILSIIAPFLGEKPIYEELYNLKDDQYEETNVVDNIENKKVLEKLRKRCDELVWEAKGDAELPDTYIENMNEKLKVSIEKEYGKLKKSL